MVSHRVGVIAPAAFLFFWTTCLAAWPVDAETEQRVLELCHEWQDEELPIEALAIEPGKKPSRRVSALEAAEDVERLFYLFSHGYSGYAFFDAEGSFERARSDILEELESRDEWRVVDLAPLFRKHLQFIRDCHTKIGGQSYGGHEHFWFDTSLELRKSGDEFRFDSRGDSHVVTSINGDPPDDWIRPSLSASGEAIYRIGTLSTSMPGTVTVEARGESGPRTLDLRLRRSDHFSYSREIFREDRVGGIPVLRMRSFSDHHSDYLEKFVEAADRYRGAPVVVVDIRGNGGGSEYWVNRWVQRLTGERPGSIFIFSELTSRTTMMGRANAMRYWLELYPETEFYREEAARYSERAEGFGAGGNAPFWTGPLYPDNPTIPNATTIVVITNGWVASAAEGFVMRASQAERVVVVGENTRGALTFGNVSAHQLPRSGLMVWLPINFGLFPDLEFREERGLSPDYWVPSADAVNHAVAAVRAGTIATARPLAPETLEQELVPEVPRHRGRLERTRRGILVGLLAAGGIAWGYVMRRRPLLLAGLGVVWAIIGFVWIWIGAIRDAWVRDVGLGLLGFAILGLVSGTLHWIRLRRREAGEAGPA